MSERVGRACRPPINRPLWDGWIVVIIGRKTVGSCAKLASALCAKLMSAARAKLASAPRAKLGSAVRAKLGSGPRAKLARAAH